MTRTVEDMYPSTVVSPTPDLKRPLLLPTHSAAAPATVSIAHAQLRHLICCPSQRGIVYYIGGKCICERDVLNPAFPPRVVIDTEFPPTCFAAITVSENPTTILFAAGGYSSELHLSLHAFMPSAHTPSSSTTPSPIAPKLLWRTSHRLPGRSEIVNSIMFTPASLTDDTRRAPTDLRIAVSGNDATVKLFEVALRRNVEDHQRLQGCGSIKLETPVNHMSFSPDGRTLLCVGDTPKAYLFQITPGSHVVFSPLAVYTLPPAPPRPLMHHPPSSPTTPPDNFGSQACFSTAWSADGLKFAVASQEGQLCVWDVRSARPLLTYWTPFRRNSAAAGAGGQWEWEDLGGPMRSRSDDATNNGPDSGIRNVRFSAGEGGRELLVFVEHTMNVHVMDARTLDLASHSVVQFPPLAPPRTPPPAVLMRSTSPEQTPTIIRSTTPEQRPIVVAQEDVRPPTFEGHWVTRSRSRSRTPPPARTIIIPRTQPIPDNRRLSRSRSRSPTPPFGYARRRSPSPPGVIIIAGRRSPSPVSSRSRSRSHSLESPPQIVWPRLGSREDSQEPIMVPGPEPHAPRRRFLARTAVPYDDDEGSASVMPQIIMEGRRRSSSPPVLMEGGLEWGAGRMQHRGVRLDADGDVIGELVQAAAAAAGGSPVVQHQREIVMRRREREFGRRPVQVQVPVPMREQERERERGEGLEAVEEGGEPPPVQRPTHLAGMCFDPSGGWVYVASEGGIVEWRVREREEGKTCWGSGAWA